MEAAIWLALAASFCTATSSVCQRLGAKSLESSGFEVRGFDVWLVFRLARQPVWLLGFATMIAGFVLQVSALRYGPLALVQPILAVELVFVFGYLAVVTRCRRVGWREWLAAAAMSAGVSVFRRAARGVPGHRDRRRMGFRRRRHQGAELAPRRRARRDLQQLVGLCPDERRNSDDAADLARDGGRTACRLPARVHDL